MLHYFFFVEDSDGNDIMDIPETYKIPDEKITG